MRFDTIHRYNDEIKRITAEDFFQAIDKFNITHNPEEDKPQCKTKTKSQNYSTKSTPATKQT